MKIENIDTWYSSISSQAAKESRSNWIATWGKGSKKGKMKDAKKEILFSELHSLLTSGIDFNRAFTLLIQNEKDIRAKQLLEQMHIEVVKGDCLWQSLARKEEFSVLDSGVIRIGEETGRIADSLHFLSEFYTKKIAQKRMIYSAVSYPVMIMITAVIVMAFMLLVIVPLFVDVYSRTGGELPGITTSVIAFSENFHYFLLALIVIGAMLGFIFNPKQKKDSIRRIRSQMLLKMPFIGEAIRINYQSYFCKLLFLLYSSGISLLHSIEMLVDIIPFYPYQKSFVSIAKGLNDGDSFSESIACFPELYDNRLITLLRVGEETNKLAPMLDKQGRELAGQMEYKIKKIGNMLEPLLILFVGILVATILISMYLPMFKMGTVIQ